MSTFTGALRKKANVSRKIWSPRRPSTQIKQRSRSPGGKSEDDEEETEAKKTNYQKNGDKRKADDDEAFFEACKRALHDDSDNPSSSSTDHRPQKRERDRGEEKEEEGEAEKKIRAEVNGLAVDEEEIYLDEQAWDDVHLGEELDIEKV